MPTLITTTDAVESIEAAAFAKNAVWYREFKYVCLIANTKKDRERPTNENFVQYNQ